MAGSGFAGVFKPRRELGRTGFMATALGIGDLADRKVPLEDCVATVHRAMDAGLNLIDTAPAYESGYSEEIVGRALKGRRDGMFVIDKIDHTDQPVAPQIDQSLRTLGLEAVDLWVFHTISDMAAWRGLCEPGGVMDQLAACVAAGKSRFKGISSHSPDVLRAALAAGALDVIMFPVGPYVHPAFVDEILPLARKLGVATVCFKTFGAGKLVADTAGYGASLKDRPRGKVSSGGDNDGPILPHLSVAECVRYTLTLDPDVALLGLSFPNEQDAAFAVARDFHPLSPAEEADIRRRAAEAVAGKGPCWWNPDPTMTTSF